ncbi:MAG TPA: hypothetical protein VMV71_01240 [Candidatus Paceibacterota bacterium]|nr:hypothetical protein [Candidatus Paceibacterota bacterium]
MLLSRTGIVRHLKEGTIIIDPFVDFNLKTSSYDVTLGEWYWKERNPSGRHTIHNMYDKKSTDKVWEGPMRAELASDLRERTGVALDNIPDGAKVILLGPGETVLGHTNEYIGGRKVCVAKMYARSSLGRNFIEVCKDAGWGDIGYFNRWTMEITNNSKNFSIPLVVGRRIAQMVFYEVEPLEGDYVDEKGKYQVSAELDELKKLWHPDMMLPRMHLDREVVGE